MVTAAMKLKDAYFQRKAMTNLDSILKSRDITLSTKVHLVIAMVFLVVMYGCESWTIKKAEHQRIDAFELRCWRRLFRVPWTARRSNQSILKEINPEYSLEGPILKVKLQNFPLTFNCENFQMYTKVKGKMNLLYLSLTVDCCFSVAKLCPILCNPLEWPPCPSPTPGIYSDSCPLSP